MVKQWETYFGSESTVCLSISGGAREDDVLLFMTEAFSFLTAAPSSPRTLSFWSNFWNIKHELNSKQ
jgi:hypothetical protein